MDTKLKDKIRQLASDGRISCSKALSLAEDLDVSPSKVGAICDQLSIKIKGCQLGCFK